MKEFLTILMAAGIPSTIFGLAINWYVKRQEKQDKAKQEMNILLIQGVVAAISLGEASAIALRDGKTNGETKAGLASATKVKAKINDFFIKQGVESIL